MKTTIKVIIAAAISIGVANANIFDTFIAHYMTKVYTTEHGMGLPKHVQKLPEAIEYRNNFKRSMKIEEFKRNGLITIITAGTSDIPIAEEAFVTARTLGSEASMIYDVGVAGIHRLFNYLEQIRKARVVIVVAGMEGALASVVGGLVDKPIIAVPTSIGYGASFSGISALLTMLNSCTTGVAVVNIDNGFGAACIAHRIKSLQEPSE